MSIHQIPNQNLAVFNPLRAYWAFLGLVIRAMTNDQKFDRVIGGVKWPTPEYRSIQNPADHSAAGLAPVGSVGDLDLAVAAAHAAQPSWQAQGEDVWRKACEDVAGVLSDHAAGTVQILGCTSLTF